jgi:hypothetical protein
VQGYIVRGPLGGLVWHHLQYVIGLRRLGHDVYFIEDSDDYESCFNPDLNVTTADPSFGLRFASDSFEQVGLGDRWAYFDAHQRGWLGPAGGAALELFRSADVLLNVSGVNPLREWSLRVPHRALIDTDPVFTQVRNLIDERRMQQSLAHTAFFSFGENFGQPQCSIPDDGIPWQPTRQPVALDIWNATPDLPGANFTTVMQWDSYPPAEYAGKSFGMKSASFSPFLDLPQRARQRLELAVGSPTAPRDRLRELGWVVTDPLAITRTAQTFLDYVHASKAEFSVAKHGYVVSCSGWFSERSAGYLASGRPVITQETGFTDWLPSGTGLLAFSNPEEAIEAIDRVDKEYETHCRTAREIADEYFAADKVLSALLDRI